ncbi:MAG: carbohydrate porin, partial [Succinivibrio sp.]|nr:carbohydrate porin [Succinivibrio sp.]
RGQKATIAYAITPDAKNFWSRPEIRLFATWVHSPDENVTSSAYSYRDPLSETGLEEGKTNCVVGAQVESWF